MGARRVDVAPELLGFASFAFAAGAATFFAPCAYPLLPGYVAYFVGRGDDRSSGTGAATGAGPETSSGVATRAGAGPWRAALVGLQVVAGFALVYVALAGVVVVAGSRALANIVVLELVVGSVLVVLGTGMALGRSVARGAVVRLPERRRSATGFVCFGVCYATAAAGCTAPVFLAVAGVALGGGPTAAVVGLGGYAAGMGALMVAVTVLASLGRTAMLDRLPEPAHVSRAAGVLLVLAGLAQLGLFVFRYDGLSVLGLA